MKRLSALILALLLVPSLSFAGQIQGTLQTPTGGTVSNGTLTFTLSQAALVPGSSSIVPSTVSCYTSNTGIIVGVPDALSLPVVSTNTASGTLASGTYYVKITYWNGTGESAASPEKVVVLSAQGTLIIQAPTIQPANASGYKVYISSATGTEKLQGTVTGWTNFSQSSSLVSVTSPPANNTSSCSLRFSDELIPTGTYYTVNLLNVNGSQFAGYPQTWCTYGGAGGVINVSNGAPTGNCGTNGVFYPTPIMANPAASPQSISGDLGVSGDFSAKRISGMPYADKFSGIQAAIDDLGGSSGTVYLPCGTYVGNITISNGGQRIIGQAQACVHIQPSVLSSPAITYASTSTGGNGLNYDGLEEVSIECPLGQTCTSDGIQFTGTDPNDRHTFKNVTITGLGGFNTGFQNGINIVGRMIWTEFDHVEVRYMRGDGLHAVTSAVVNHIDFKSSQFVNGQNYGINFQNSNATPSLDINFYHLNVENNGASTSTSPCAGLYISGIGSGGIYGGYFENDCPSNAHANTAEIRITGTFAQSFNVIGVVFNAMDAINFWDIYNDAVQTTGVYEGNRNGAGKGFGVATQHVLSSITVGVNFNFNVIATPDANANTHVNMTYPFAFDMTAVSTVTSNTIDASLTNNLAIFSGPFTINTITGGHRGQLLFIRPITQIMTFGHLAGNIVLQGGLNRAVNPTETIGFIFDGTNWVQTGFDPSQVPGALTVPGLATLTGGAKIGPSGSTISDSRELIQNAHSCGTTTTCANTANGSNRMIFGTVALTSATPSTAVVSGISPLFTSTTSYVCVLTNMTTQANPVKVTNTSTSSFTITGPNTVTDTVAYQCVGN